MATIIRTRVVCDGVDVDCVLASGERRTFHRQGAGAINAQSFVDGCEAALVAIEDAAQGYTITCEDGTVLDA